MPDGYTIKHDAELERDYGKWVLVRRSLGIRSFGINIVELAHGEAIPEHHELDRGHEEIFFVIEGLRRSPSTTPITRSRREPSCALRPSRCAPFATTATASRAS